MNIYVGNLSDHTSEDQLRNLFSPFGEIKTLKIITDGYTGHSRGFGFVEMQERNSGEAAVEKLNNTLMDNQTITVNEARTRNNTDRNLKRRY